MAIIPFPLLVHWLTLDFSDISLSNVWIRLKSFEMIYYQFVSLAEIVRWKKSKLFHHNMLCLFDCYRIDAKPKIENSERKLKNRLYSVQINLHWSMRCEIKDKIIVLGFELYHYSSNFSLLYFLRWQWWLIPSYLWQSRSRSITIEMLPDCWNDHRIISDHFIYRTFEKNFFF